MAEITKSVIIIAPSHSQATILSLEATQELNKYFIERGYPTFYLNGFKARKLPFLITLNKTQDDRRLFVYIGHGLETTLIGDEILNQRLPPLQLITTRDDPLNQKILNSFSSRDIFVTISCQAEQLGNFLVQNYGIQSFYTSSRKMWISHGYNTETERDQDFIDLFVMIPKLLEQGMNTYMALEHYKYLIRTYLSQSHDEVYKKYMFENLNYYKLIGDNVTW